MEFPTYSAARGRADLLTATGRGDTVNGKIPLGWIMPMLAGFRANVDWNKLKGSFSWIRIGWQKQYRLADELQRFVSSDSGVGA